MAEGPGIATQVSSRSSSGPAEVWDETAIQKASPFDAFKVPVLRVLLAVAIFAAWELVSRTVVDEFFISRPTAIAVRVWDWTTSGILTEALGFTLYAMLFGLLIGAVSGILLGLLLGRARLIAQVLDPFIVAIYSLPKVALVPLFLLWFGIGLRTNTAVAALTVFFLVFYNTYSGTRDVDQELIDVVRLMGGSRKHVFLRVIIPSATVWIFTGLRLAVPYALIGAIVGEIVASDRGLGFLIRRSAGFYDTAGVFAALLVLMLISSGLNYLVNRFEDRTSKWRSLTT